MNLKVSSFSSFAFLCIFPVTECELERLQQALKILSDAEKQLKVSSERSTWFTAALLQLGSGHDAQQTPAISHEPNTVLMRTTSRSPTPHGHRRSESLPSQLLPSKVQAADHEMTKDLAEIWKRCIERCHPKKLRELLYDHGKLVSITESEGKPWSVFSYPIHISNTSI